MKKTIVRAVSAMAVMATLILGGAAEAQATNYPPNHDSVQGDYFPAPTGAWTLTQQTPISSGYWYTYTSSDGRLYLTREFQGDSFEQFEPIVVPQEAPAPTPPTPPAPPAPPANGGGGGGGDGSPSNGSGSGGYWSFPSGGSGGGGVVTVGDPEPVAP